MVYCSGAPTQCTGHTSSSLLSAWILRLRLLRMERSINRLLWGSGGGGSSDTSTLSCRRSLTAPGVNRKLCDVHGQGSVIGHAAHHRHHAASSSSSSRRFIATQQAHPASAVYTLPCVCVVVQHRDCSFAVPISHRALVCVVAGSRPLRASKRAAHMLWKTSSTCCMLCSVHCASSSVLWQWCPPLLQNVPTRHGPQRVA